MATSEISVVGASGVKKRNRQTNFSAQEISLIADEVRVRHTVLFGPFSSTVTSSAKLREWDEIATKLNACTSIQRSGTQIRKKWNDYKSQVKKRAIDVRRESCKTGGGPAPVGLSDLEHKVVSLIPQCQIEGIPGGLESEVDEASSNIENAAVDTHSEIEDTFEAGLPSTAGQQPLPAEQQPVPAEQQQSSAETQPSTAEQQPSTSASTSDSMQQDNQRPKIPENAKSGNKPVSRSRIKTTESQPGMATLLETEKEKSVVMRELLAVQRRILAVSEQRLQVESDRLALERERFEFKKLLLHITSNKSVSPVIGFLNEL